MKKILLLLVLFGLFFQSNAQRNYAAKKLLFSQVQKPYVNYGYLYNWYAATDSRNITSSDDWVVPTYSNFSSLQTYLGGYLYGGGMKEIGLTYWGTPNAEATNANKFNGRGGGIRINETGVFESIKAIGFYWASTQYDSNSAYAAWQQYQSGIFGIDFSRIKQRGHSIRLIKTSTALSNGQEGLYTGNDGKIYRTICIGSQEWLADNLAETKFRNGDLITVVTDNAAWVALTTEARCVYNNDESYR